MEEGVTTNYCDSVINKGADYSIISSSLKNSESMKSRLGC